MAMTPLKSPPEEDATAIEDSELSTGDGDDSVEVTAEAIEDATAIEDSESRPAMAMTPLKSPPKQKKTPRPSKTLTLDRRWR